MKVSLSDIWLAFVVLSAMDLAFGGGTYVAMIFARTGFAICLTAYALVNRMKERAA